MMRDKKNGNIGGSQIEFPHSRRVYVAGDREDIRVPFREIHLNVTRGMNGASEENLPVRVYDSTGPWGDPTVTCSPSGSCSP